MQGGENKVPIPFTMQQMPFLLTECLNTKSHKLRGYSYLEGIYKLYLKTDLKPRPNRSFASYF